MPEAGRYATFPTTNAKYVLTRPTIKIPVRISVREWITWPNTPIANPNAITAAYGPMLEVAATGRRASTRRTLYLGL